MVTALVMSGGGSHGAFQMGAVRYLYKHQNVRPDIICGSSVGAINGVKLAEAGEHSPTHADKVAELLAIWRRMKSPSDMWRTTDFLHAHPELEKFILAAMEEADLAALATKPLMLTAEEWARAIWQRGALDVFGAALSRIVANAEALKGLVEFFQENEQSILNLKPISALLQTEIDPQLVMSSGAKLRLAVVSLETGLLRYVTETGMLLERDNQTEVKPTTWPKIPQSCKKASKALEEARAEYEGHSITASGATSAGEKAAAVAMRAKAYSQVIEKKAALDACLLAHKHDPARVKVATGVMASASIPIAFPPVEMLGEHYVDGGVRELLPFEVAATMGADKIYAIPATPLLGSDHDGSFKKRGALDIAMRSFNVMYDEIAREESEFAVARVRSQALPAPAPVSAASAGLDPKNFHGGGVVVAPGPKLTAAVAYPEVFVIAPETDFYGITDINPASLEANMAYGWMKAYEATHNLTPGTGGDADDIARRIFEMDKRKIAGADQSTLDAMRVDLLAQRDARISAQAPESVPPEADNW